MSTNDRADFARTGEECRRSRTCQLHRSHGGACDARPESERWTDVWRLLDDEEAPPESGEIERRARSETV